MEIIVSADELKATKPMKRHRNCFAIPRMELFIFKSVWSVTGNTIDAMMEDRHSLWDFGELYFQLDLTCKDIKSVIGNRRSLNVSERHHKTLLSVRGLSCCRGTLIFLS